MKKEYFVKENNGTISKIVEPEEFNSKKDVYLRGGRTYKIETEYELEDLKAFIDFDYIDNTVDGLSNIGNVIVLE